MLGNLRIVVRSNTGVSSKNKFLRKSVSLVGSAAVVGSTLSGVNAKADNLLENTLEKSLIYRFFRFLNLTWFMNKIRERAIRNLGVGKVLNGVLSLVEKEFESSEEGSSIVVLGEDQKPNKNASEYYRLNSSNKKYGFYFDDPASRDEEYILFEIIEEKDKDNPRTYGKRLFSFDVKNGDTKEALEFFDKIELFSKFIKLKRFMDENKDLFSKDGEIKFDCTIDKQKLKKLDFDSDRKYILFNFQDGGLKMSIISRFGDQQERKYAINCIETIINRAKAHKNINNDVVALKVGSPNEINNS